MTQLPNNSGPNFAALILTALVVIIGWNVWAARRDSSGMECYAQPASAECPSYR